MKTTNKLIGMALIAIVTLAFFACGDKGDDPQHVHEWEWVVTTAATTEAEGVETQTCKTCGATNGTRPIAKLPLLCTCPNGTTHYIEDLTGDKCCNGSDCTCTIISEQTKKTFTVSFDFQNPTDPTVRYNVSIKDERTNVGRTLEDVKVTVGNEEKNIVTIIEEAVMGAFSSNQIPPVRFRNVFGVTGGVTIYVENTTPAYKMKATDKNSIYIHIDYLKSSPTAIQQNITNAVNAMNPGGPSLPFEVPNQQTTQTLTFTGQEQYGTYSVTVKSFDLYTDADWATDVAKVVTAIMRGYNKDMGLSNLNNVNKSFFVVMFADNRVATAVLSKTATYDCEVKVNDYTTLYLKTSALDTVDLQPAIWAWVDKEAYHP